jgi:hypothetical protein
MADAPEYIVVADLCPNTGELVHGVNPTVIGGVEHAPCPRCEGAPAPVFATSEGKFVRRYKSHVLRQRVTP